MKLKDLILENKLKPELISFVEELNSGKWYNGKKLLYRGESYEPNVWDIHSIRKNRLPRNTSRTINLVINGINLNKYPHIPRRDEVKYAGGSKRKDEMKKYGTLVVCFPHNDAKIFNLEEDSFEIFQSLGNSFLKDVNLFDLGEIGRKYNLRVLERFSNLMDMGPQETKIMKLFENKYLKLKEELKKIKNITNLTSDQKKGSKTLLKIFNTIEKKYFDKLEKGINPSAHEHIFDGDEYLIIKSKIFEENFVYNNGWKLIDN